MDMQNTMSPAEPMAAPAAPVNPTPVTPMASGVKYASFPERFLASLIDGILVAVVTNVALAVFGGQDAPGFVTIVLQVATVAYYVYFISQQGATLGKKVLKIRVQKESGQNLTLVDAILREVVGKFISTIVLFLGFFWMLWDPQKQTWHDKLAKSVVVKL